MKAMSKTTALVEVKDLVKIYGKGQTAFTALRGINFEVQKGEVIAVIGKSGSGKSTLMHLMALLDSPSSGSVLLKGVDSSSLRRQDINAIRNREYGFVFQQFFLNASESVLSNVTLPLKIAGVPSSKRKKRGMEALKSVELEDKATNKASQLSGGQKQRVAIARALINNPAVIFADEPTGNLDTVTGKKIEDLLLGLNKNKGITLIFVTHDEELASRCQRRIYIQDGQIMKSGSAR